MPLFFLFVSFAALHLKSTAMVIAGRLCLCEGLFICALWSPAGKGLTSWPSFLVSNCELAIPDLCTLTYFYTQTCRLSHDVHFISSFLLSLITFLN